MHDERKLAPPGWYKDKTGRNRWWDGSEWGPLAPGQRSAGPQAGPGTRNCPHCGSMGPATASKCPSCGRGYKNRTMLKLWGTVAALTVLVIVGFALLVRHELKVDESEFEKTAITKEQFRQIEMGMTEQEVRSALKVEPDIEEEEMWESTHGGGEVERLCLYYNKAGDYPNWYRFCFDEGKLKSRGNW